MISLPVRTAKSTKKEKDGPGVPKKGKRLLVKEEKSDSD